MTAPQYLGPVLRRWYVFMFGLLLTGLLAVYMSSGVAPTYTSTASIVLIPGPQSIPEGGNPFLYLGNLTQARDVLVQSLTTDPALTDLIEGMPGSTVTAAADAMSSGPLVEITVTAPDSATATDLRDAAKRTLTAQLDLLQGRANTPERSRMSALVLSSDQAPEISARQRTRALIAIAALGVALSLGFTAVLDLVLRSDWRERRRRRVLRSLAHHPRGRQARDASGVTQSMSDAGLGTETPEGVGQPVPTSERVDGLTPVMHGEHDTRGSRT